MLLPSYEPTQPTVLDQPRKEALSASRGCSSYVGSRSFCMTTSATVNILIAARAESPATNDAPRASSDGVPTVLASTIRLFTFIAPYPSMLAALSSHNAWLLEETSRANDDFLAMCITSPGTKSCKNLPLRRTEERLTSKQS